MSSTPMRPQRSLTNTSATTQLSCESLYSWQWCQQGVMSLCTDICENSKITFPAFCKVNKMIFFKPMATKQLVWIAIQWSSWHTISQLFCVWSSWIGWVIHKGFSCVFRNGSGNFSLQAPCLYQPGIYRVSILYCWLLGSTSWTYSMEWPRTKPGLMKEWINWKEQVFSFHLIWLLC